MRLFRLNSLRRPTLPHSYPCSTIGPERLNFRVRDGNGCDPLGITTEKLVTLTLARRGNLFLAIAFHDLVGFLYDARVCLIDPLIYRGVVAHPPLDKFLWSSLTAD